mmetsp:Transcript_28109/g.50327  ORF Transcript_28109/g.50327 Transcript_28109/m.50327 type:complete len:325 (-) Transcript_28109:19-993(-)|eukprot:CAMPEP_0204896796 /NCGR_PEP_ID=MMETSP1397-20131031/372_1 /ASSEMBLY_ACC=CAM_ASM_000891 /TAXON_ID=49980 /ORGANISM="Climacostomum Climacostomum virens, Strain Stock W-24" /LENGTH=324 /DNA_ID=CAMNT_0052064461 /DNA_START=218 /DNA_END=1192 /DNA_ORIENTATION=+
MKVGKPLNETNYTSSEPSTYTYAAPVQQPFQSYPNAVIQPSQGYVQPQVNPLQPNYQYPQVQPQIRQPNYAVQPPYRAQPGYAVQPVFQQMQPTQPMFMQVTPAPLVLAPVANDPNYIDYGPGPEWEPIKSPGLGLTAGHRHATTRLKLPVDNQVNMSANAVTSYEQFCGRGVPFPYPSSAFSFNYNSNSVIASVCSQAELSDFVKQANDFCAPFINKVQTTSKVTFRIRLGIASFFIILAIVLGILANAGLGVALAIIGVASFLISRCFYVCWLKRAVEKFHKDMAIWIKGIRGHLYEKGVKPRPGYNGCFILFEANLAVQIG